MQVLVKDDKLYCKVSFMEKVSAVQSDVNS